MRRIFSSMNTRMDARLIPVLLAVLLAFAAGCASTPEPAEEPGDIVDSEFNDASGDASSMADSNMDDMAASRDFDIAAIYFDFDRSDIKPQYQSILRSAAKALEDSGASVTIEGHCDERGSEEYNIALGERRAAAVRNYLYNLGVPMNQMSIISYGEARPAVSGSGEAAWRLNRRAEFRVR